MFMLQSVGSFLVFKDIHCTLPKCILSERLAAGANISIAGKKTAGSHYGMKGHYMATVP